MQSVIELSASETVLPEKVRNHNINYQVNFTSDNKHQKSLIIYIYAVMFHGQILTPRYEVTNCSRNKECDTSLQSLLVFGIHSASLNVKQN